MAFINKTDIMQLWQYRITEFKLFINDGKKNIKEYDLRERLKSIIITNDYEGNLFPLFRVSCVMEADVYYDMLRYKNNSQIHIRIQKFYRKVAEESTSLVRDYINDKFNLILEDSDFDTSKATREHRDKYNYKQRSESTYNDLVYVDNDIELFLYKKEFNEKFNTLVNAILQDANTFDALLYLFNKANLKNILITRPENPNNYKELIIPPMKIKDAIKWIDTYYGLYNTAMMFYVDIVKGVTYILKYDGQCNAYRHNEPQNTCIMIPKDKGVNYMIPCNLKKEDNDTDYIIVNNETVHIRNESITYNILNESDIISVDSYSGNINTLKSDINVSEQRSAKVIDNNTENPFFGNIYVSRIGTKDTVVELTLSDFDIDSITPNRRFKLLFEDSDLANKYNGNYKITSVAHTFVRNGRDFKINSVAIMKKIK